MGISAITRLPLQCRHRLFDAFAATIAARIDAERYALAARWLDRLVALIPVGPNDVFPTETLLDHVPKLIEQIAKFLAAPENEIASDTFVVAEARELGELRHQQQASVHQLLREYELLRNILGTFVGERPGGCGSSQIMNRFFWRFRGLTAPWRF